MNDEQGVLDNMDDWIITDDEPAKHYCPDCHFMNDLDIIEIRTERKKVTN